MRECERERRGVEKSYKIRRKKTGGGNCTEEAKD